MRSSQPKGEALTTINVEKRGFLLHSVGIPEPVRQRSAGSHAVGISSSGEVAGQAAAERTWNEDDVWHLRQVWAGAHARSV